MALRPFPPIRCARIPFRCRVIRQSDRDGSVLDVHSATQPIETGTLFSSGQGTVQDDGGALLSTVKGETGPRSLQWLLRVWTSSDSRRRFYHGTLSSERRYVAVGRGHRRRTSHQAYDISPPPTRGSTPDSGARGTSRDARRAGRGPRLWPTARRMKAARRPRGRHRTRSAPIATPPRRRSCLLLLPHPTVKPGSFSDVHM